MAPRYRFFGGKGGVGKTTCSAAAATGLARRGAHVLAISTDPAHSLGDVLGKRLGAKPKKVGRLQAMELSADQALQRWLDERRELLTEIADRGTWLDRSDVERFLSLSFPGVDELVALLEIVRLADAGDWDEVVVDTAPTGHTLRMLAMPDTLARVAGVLDDMQGKHRVIADALGGAPVPDEADELIEEIRADAERLAAVLRDPARSTFHWVTAAEPMSLAESADAVAALAHDGIGIVELIANRLTPKPRGACATCTARRALEQAELDSLPPVLRSLPLRTIEEADRDPVAAAERALFSKPALPRQFHPERAPLLHPERAKRVEGLSGPPAPLPLDPSVRLVLVGGKGGVGKTTVAAALALETATATPSRRVLVMSIDPAHSLGDALGETLGATDRAVTGGPPNLRARELDAPAEFARMRDRYRGAVDDLFDRLRGDSRFDATYDRAIVRDLLDLSPPGLDEIFAILAVVDALGLDGTTEAAFDRVVLDTAPTGHALRLLEMPERAHAWVKTLLEVLLKYRGVVKGGTLAEDLVAMSRGLRALRALLSDGERTAFVVVARPEPVVVAETRRLLSALREKKIPVRGLVVNSLTPPGCPRCRAVAKREAAAARDLAKGARGSRSPRGPSRFARNGKGCAIIHAPLVVPPPRGAEALLAFRDAWRAPKAKRTSR